MGLSVYTFEPISLKAEDLFPIASDYFHRLLNLSDEIDLGFQFREGWQGKVFHEWRVEDKRDIQNIYSEYLDTYLMIGYDYEEYWKDSGFEKPAYCFTVYDKLRGNIKPEIPMAASIILACAKLMQQKYISTCNLWTELIDLESDLQFVLTDDIVSKASNDIKAPFTEDSLDTFNFLALRNFKKLK